MKTTKSLLLASAAIAVVAMTPSSAKAFDDVDWTWVVNATKTITENITITDSFDLSGLATIEAAQINIGNVTATATLTDFENNPPVAGDGNGDGFVSIDETFVFDVPYEDATDPDSIIPAGPVLGSNGQLSGSVLSGTIDEGQDTLNDLTFQVTGEIPVDALELAVNDAYDLPKVENIATAVANNFSVDSTVGANLHVGQYNWGGYDTVELEDIDFPPQEGFSIDGELAELALAYFGSDVTDNPFQDMAVFGVLAGAFGTITQGEVEATATVDGDDLGEIEDISVLNASVENAATAVGNNISVGIEATLQGDAYAVADLTQFNYANTTATALVDDVQINGYSGFGDAGMGPCGGCLNEANLNVGPQIPIISNVATAVGNNISLSLNNASVVVPPVGTEGE